VSALEEAGSHHETSSLLHTHYQYTGRVRVGTDSKLPDTERRRVSIASPLSLRSPFSFHETHHQPRAYQTLLPYDQAIIPN
jgi:hypothetical protein